MTAIIALILSNLPELIKLGQAGYNLVMAARAACQQSGEWTADMELEFQSKLAAEKIDPAWLPDTVTAPGIPPELIKLGQAGYNLVMAARAACQQSGEWTADMELEFQSKLAAEKIDPAWLPDTVTAPGIPSTVASQASASADADGSKTPEATPEVASVAAPTKIVLGEDGWHREVPA